MQPLYELAASLATPPPGNELLFESAGIDPNGLVRVGRSSDKIALLFATKKSTTSRPPIELHRLSVLFDQHCSVSSSDGPEDAHLTLVAVNAEDSRAVSVFLTVFDALLPVLLPQLSDERIEEAIENIVDVFRLVSKPALTNVLGAWGELFVISKSSDPAGLVSAWHSTPSDRFDLARGNQRAEIKTTTGKRVHRFSHEQLAPGPHQTVVVSVVTERSAAGSSIPDLVEAISAHLTTLESRAQLLTTVAQSVGEQWAEAVDQRFDEKLAESTLRLYDSVSIPRVTGIPDEVTALKYSVDMESQRPLDSASGELFDDLPAQA